MNESARGRAHRWARRILEMCVFAMIAALMLCSKLIMEFLPNIHLLGMFTMLCAIVFRAKGLIPIYLYVMLNGVIAGFNLWWVPYLYIWTVLWGMTMLIPKNISPKVAAVVYPTVCALHGLLYGTLYAPAQALMLGFDFEQTVAWIVAGLPFDIVHCVGNAVAGLLILPLSQLLPKLMKRI
ncbi:MAG: hypothetical protein IJX74_05695 [Clostridia bacterium]|nr:hypothetical protein [Clostridia bacterium]